MAQEREGVGTYLEFKDNVLPRVKAAGSCVFPERRARLFFTAFFPLNKEETVPLKDPIVTPDFDGVLTAVQVNLKAPVAPSHITTNSPIEICYGSDAVMTANADIDYPQTVTWYDADRTIPLPSSRRAALSRRRPAGLAWAATWAS